MAANVSVAEIFNAKITLPLDKSWLLWNTIVDNAEWLHYEAPWCDHSVMFANLFINNYARVPGIGSYFYTSHPLHVFGGTYNEEILTGLLYQNGAVAVIEAENSSVLHIFISRDTVELFCLPEPKDFDTIVKTTLL